ncbi:MAG: DedA family protein [Bryobacteraceae bacterium]|nr:DedA family protein [Bryobacteraceae bacterium]
MIEQLLRQYGYLFVYVGTLFEPDATLVASIFLAHRGYFQIGFVWFFATLATISMSQFWFWLARQRGRAMLDRMTASSPRYARVRGWVERNGNVLVFFSRFLWGLRLAIAASCGATGVSPVRFLIVDTAGALFWTAVVGTVGFAIAQAMGRAIHYLRPYEDAIALGIVGVLALFAFSRRLEGRREVRDVLRPGQLGLDAIDHVGRKVARADDR